jgi:hypothetical protein
LKIAVRYNIIRIERDRGWKFPQSSNLPYRATTRDRPYCPRKYLEWVSTRDTHTSFLDDGIREFFAGEETHTLLGRHFDRLAVSRIDTLAGGTCTDLERTKAY